MVDIYAEFLSKHPNGIPFAAEFVAICLDEAGIKSKASVVRMSSYRWQDVAGVGEGGDQFSIPSNCEPHCTAV